ncbi:MAG: ABC transporter substrate-binding protein [Acidobacteriota bacterium]
MLTGAHLRPLLALVLLGLVSLGCGFREPETPIQIGFLSSLTGDSASYGVANLQGVELAIDQINQRGGILLDGRKRPIELLVRDTKAVPETSLEAALELINRDQVVALVGPFQSETAIPVAVAAEQAGVPMLSPASSHPEVTRGKRYVFRISFLDAAQAKAMARFAHGELGLETAATLYDKTNPHSHNFAETFQREIESLGARLVANEPYFSGETDFSAALTRIRDSGARALLLPNFELDVVRQVSQARDLGLEVIFLGSDSWRTETMAGLPVMQGAYLSEQWHPDLGNPQSRAFVESFKATYGQSPGSGAALGFDAVGLLAHVIESQDSLEPQPLRDGLANLTGYPGVTGPISYQGSGDPIRGVVIISYLDGATVFHGQVAPQPPG